MNEKTVKDIIEYTIKEYFTNKCKGNVYYYNQFLKNKDNFHGETEYNESVPPGKGEFELRQIAEQRKVDFTTDEVDYVYDYTDEGYFRLNSMLWDNDDWHNAIKNGWIIDDDIKYYQEEHQNVRSAIEKAPRLTQDTILFHGGIFDESLKVGDVSNFKGFTSTSYKREISERIFTGNGNNEYLIKMYAPQGTKGIVITGSDPEFGSGSEHEFLLKDNTRFQVLNIDSGKNPPEAEVLLLPDNYTRGYDG